MQGTISTVVGATGYEATLVGMVADAWVDIQSARRNWRFMRATEDFTTVAGQSEYTITNIFGTAVSPVGTWVRDMILFNKAADNVIQLRPYDYNAYITNEIDQSTQNEPNLYAVDPVDQHLYINPPNSAYSMTAHYWTKPVILSADADVPAAPSEFHNLISYQAAAEFGAFMGNSNVFQMNGLKAKTMMGELKRSQLPSMRIVTPAVV